MIVVTTEVIGSFRAARVAINTLIVDVKFTRDVVGPLLRWICHKSSQFAAPDPQSQEARAGKISDNAVRDFSGLETLEFDATLNR